jgi:hypothetical protein
MVEVEKPPLLKFWRETNMQWRFRGVTPALLPGNHQDPKSLNLYGSVLC